MHWLFRSRILHGIRQDCPEFTDASFISWKKRETPAFDRLQVNEELIAGTARKRPIAFLEIFMKKKTVRGFISEQTDGSGRAHCMAVQRKAVEAELDRNAGKKETKRTENRRTGTAEITTAGSSEQTDLEQRDCSKFADGLQPFRKNIGSCRDFSELNAALATGARIRACCCRW